MKKLKLLFTLCALVIISACDSQARISYLTTINYGEHHDFGPIKIVFDEVISDSRCPKSVTCIRAGEAEVQVSVFLEGKLKVKQFLAFQAEETTSSKTKLIFENKKVRITGVALYPYPLNPGELVPQNYRIQVKFN